MTTKRFILMLFVMLMSVTGAWAETVSYIDVDGTSKSVDATEITNSSGTLNAGWYVVLGDDVRTRTLVCEGDVHLILADGKKLTATGSDNDAGIRVSADGASLTIYGQSEQTGQLIANGGYRGAGIGGGNNSDGHDITINGGVITATGGALASAIGGGCSANGYKITINGGSITATSRNSSASAIGSGSEGSGSSNIFVNSSLALYADGNNPPATIINHATATDVSGSLNGKRYAIVRVPVKGITVTLDKQDGTGGNDQIVVNEGEDMPTIEVPTREGYSFQGYYAGENGTGTKYYNPDGTSAHLCDLTENTTLFASWKQAVSYIDAEGTEKYVGVYDEITNSTTTLTAGWYIVRGEDVKTGILVCEGAVHIILADEAKLTATGDTFDAGICVSADGASLTIYGQSEQTGQLIANGGHGGAGIGGGNNSDGHDITINGGVITATGGYSASGIGGGKGGESSNIFVNTSMVVKANNNEESAIFIDHTTNEDISQSLAGKQYVIIRTVVESTITLDKQDGIDGDDQVTATLGSDMPAIAVPHRDGYTFRGYYTGQNGTGIKYYNHEGNGVRPCELTENTTLYAFWSQPISYIDADGTSKEVSDYEVISNTSTTLSAGWYVVCDEDVQTGELICEGNVHLILADDAKLTARGGENHAGVRVSAEGASLAIYGQSKQTGQLIATGGSRGAGIGGSDWENGHDITINGGMITATGGDGAAGIGAGDSSVGHKITIRSGKVIATGGTGGAGIGGSRYMRGYDIAITGGVVIATGGANASCIGAGEISSNRSQDIYVHDTLVLKADTQNPPVAIISHAIHTDIATDLFGKQYAKIYSPGPLTVTLDKQEGIGGSDNVTATYGKIMPTITAPMRDGYCFHGYYSGKDGTGTKYYNLDGTSAHLWDKIESATLYALWGNHTYDITAEQGSVAYYTCNVCGYIDPVRQHVHHYATEWSTDGTHHWHACTSEVGTCTAREIDEGEHSYTASDTDDSANYTCSVCEYVDEEKKAPYDARDYMNFTAVGGDVTIGIDSEKNPTCVMQYSLDRNHWTNYATKDKGNIVTLQEGETCYFRTASPTVQTTAIDIKYNPYTKSYSDDKRWWFTMFGAGTIEADGNAMSLIDQTCQSLTVGQFCFYRIFEGCSLLTVAPKLPATTLGESCYSLMFADCTNLRKAPHLPATALPFECYNYMFAGCTSLDYVEADFTRTIQHKDTYYDRMVDTSFRETTDGWLEDTADKGNLVLNRNMLGTWTDDVDLPQGWRKALKIKANEDPDHKGKFYTTYYDSWEFGLTGDFTAYYGKIVSGEGGDELRLTPLDYGVIPRESGVIICSNKPDVVLPCNRVATHSPISQDDSDLTGTNTDASAPANCYILSYGQNRLAFYKYAQGKTLSAHKAYLVYERPAGAPALRMVFEDEEETGISPLPASPKGEEMIYNLQGIRLDKLQKGINIVNGKKVLVK